MLGGGILCTIADEHVRSDAFNIDVVHCWTVSCDRQPWCAAASASNKVQCAPTSGLKVPMPWDVQAQCKAPGSCSKCGHGHPVCLWRPDLVATWIHAVQCNRHQVPASSANIQTCSPISFSCDRQPSKQVSRWRRIGCHTAKNRLSRT